MQVKLYHDYIHFGEIRFRHNNLEYRWMSNLSPTSFNWMGSKVRNVENAYQHLKAVVHGVPTAICDMICPLQCGANVKIVQMRQLNIDFPILI